MIATSVAALRRWAAKFGWSFHRSNWRKETCDNKGRYQLVVGGRTAGSVIEGDRYDASLDQIAHRIEQEERRLA